MTDKIKLDDSFGGSMQTYEGSMQFNKILNLILKNIKEKQVNLQSIHEISKIDPKLWEDWSNKVSSLDESTINQLNKSISDLLKLNEPGDFWQILILSRKLTDIQLSLPALNFEEQLEQRSIDVSEFSAKIIKFINEEIPKEISGEKLIDYFNDLTSVIIDNAVFKADIKTINSILSAILYMSLDTPEHSKYGKVLPIFEMSETSQMKDLADTIQKIDFNYKDDIVSGVIFLICQMYNLKEQDLRDDGGGISVSLIVSNLKLLM